MIAAAKERGRKYIAITDHSKRVTMANGLDTDRLREHWKNIRKIAEKTKGIEVMCGIECDILEDATLDLPDDVLAEADWVLAVLHYGLKQDKQQIHKRTNDRDPKSPTSISSAIPPGESSENAPEPRWRCPRFSKPPPTILS